MSYAPPAPIAYATAKEFRLPHTVLVRRASETSSDPTTVIAELPCHIYREEVRAADKGWAKVPTGKHKLMCDWEDARDVKAGETTALRHLDEVVHEHDGQTDTYTVSEMQVHGGVTLECIMDFRGTHA